jgi:hypothetical protein
MHSHAPPAAHEGSTVLRSSLIRAACCCLCTLLGCASAAGAQSVVGEASAVSEPAAELGVSLVPEAPPVPVGSATISRDTEGHATVRAVRVAEPLRIDGVLDEAHYTRVPSMSDFVQMEPQFGAPATERTEIWVSFDDANVYVTARMWDTDLAHLVATEMRRDSTTMFQGNDIISFILDTFYDRRNGVMFSVNPIGGRSDTQVTGERQFNQDWNPVWDVKTGRFDGGWTMEAAIPFKSLRYRSGAAQVWGFNALRTKRSKNEMSVLTRVPLGRQQAALTQTAYSASLVGIVAPRGGRNLDIKPYATSSLTTNRSVSPAIANDPTAAAGLDVKYAVTQGLAADFTVNTDFAQVEADEQQVNLTRFNLFFPEKREFFLENQGTFAFGGVQLGGNFNNNQNNNSTAPILFYSRTIGLNERRVVPLDVGGRLTGRVGRYTLGLLSTQTGAEDESLPLAARATNFSVVRLRRDILRRSSVGLIATGRSVARSGVGGNLAYGVDGAFTFFTNLNINTYWAKTETDGRHGDDTSYRGELNYNGDRYGVQLERLAVGDNFNPELGFLRRDDMVRSHAQLRFSPRPRRMKSVRRFRYQAGISYIENGAGVLESREREAEFVIEFQSGDQFQLGYSSQHELLLEPTRIVAVTLPVGVYDFQDARISMNFGRQRRVGGNLTLEHGTFYNGDRTTVSGSQGRISLTNALSIEPTYSMNKVDLVEGRFTTHLAGSRVTYTVTPLMFVSALLQYNTATNSLSTNARIRWEYRPGSELFVVYNDERNTLSRGFPSLATRSFIVKVNRLFRY